MLLRYFFSKRRRLHYLNPCAQLKKTRGRLLGTKLNVNWIKVMFLHGMGSGSCLSYTGLVLPEHTDPRSQLLFLSDSQVVAELM